MCDIWIIQSFFPQIVNKKSFAYTLQKPIACIIMQSNVVLILKPYLVEYNYNFLTTDALIEESVHLI